MSIKMMGLTLPAYYILEPTNVCNFTCSICPNSFHKAEKGFMDNNLLLKILHQISPFAKVIQLYWMGEPLLDEHIFDKIKECKSITSAKVILSTNGSLLNKDNIHKLSDSCLDELIVSVDVCDSKEIYSKIRVGGNLNTLQHNIDMLLDNCGNINVILQFIDMYLNKMELMPFIEKWKDSKTEISPLYTWANQIPALAIASDNYCKHKSNTRIPCADLWNKMSIHWNGDVSACCFDYADKIHLGNCYTHSLYEIWNGEKASKIRSDQKKGIYDGLCKTCKEWAEPDEYDAMYHLNTPR